MGRHLRKGDEPRREIHPLTREEAQKFLSTIEQHWPDLYAFFLCALRTGMRLGELLALQWGDVDFTNRFIEVQRNLVSGKLTTTKNTNRRRVDLSAHLTETFERRLVAAKAAALKAGKSEPLPWVFPNRDGEPLDGDNLGARVFQPALTKAKLRQVRIHDLRHHAGCRLMPGRGTEGADPRVTLASVPLPSRHNPAVFSSPAGCREWRKHAGSVHRQSRDG